MYSSIYQYLRAQVHFIVAGVVLKNETCGFRCTDSVSAGLLARSLAKWPKSYHGARAFLCGLSGTREGGLGSINSHSVPSTCFPPNILKRASSWLPIYND